MIFDHHQCTLGEGPLWHPERKQLFWFDILSKQLRTTDQYWQFDDYVSAAGWVDNDRLLIASSIDLILFDLSDGSRTTVCALEADNPITRSNDGRADPAGGFWIGTMGINAEPGAGAIYRYYRGELRKLYSDIQISNAICFAPSGEWAYFTDTNTQIIYSVKLNRDGWPSAEPDTHIDLRGTDYRADGAVCDQDSTLWSAQWGAGRIARYDTNGAFVQAIDLPVSQASCPAFGGAGLQTLYCTTAAVDRSGADDGKVFAFDVDAKGQREHQVILG